MYGIPITSTGGSAMLAQSITFAQLSSPVDLATKAMVNVSDPVTADVTIPTPLNIPIGLFGFAWVQDGTGGHTITLPNGTTITGGLPNEPQSAMFSNSGVNQFKLVSG
jgi:hypothetical protein